MVLIVAHHAVEPLVRELVSHRDAGGLGEHDGGVLHATEPRVAGQHHVDLRVRVVAERGTERLHHIDDVGGEPAGLRG